jgi:hypothetical protein
MKKGIAIKAAIARRIRAKMSLSIKRIAGIPFGCMLLS